MESLSVADAREMGFDISIESSALEYCSADVSINAPTDSEAFRRIDAVHIRGDEPVGPTHGENHTKFRLSHISASFPPAVVVMVTYRVGDKVRYFKIPFATEDFDCS
jgi:hypothetical protein